MFKLKPEHHKDTRMLQAEKLGLVLQFLYHNQLSHYEVFFLHSIIANVWVKPKIIFFIPLQCKFPSILCCYLYSSNMSGNC